MKWGIVHGQALSTRNLNQPVICRKKHRGGLSNVTERLEDYEGRTSSATWLIDDSSQ